MEMIGRSISSFQSAISSGLDSVTSGLRASTPSGISSIQSAFEPFSSSDFALAAMPNLQQALSSVGDYKDPVAYLATQAAPSELYRTMQSSIFRPEVEIASFLQAIEERENQRQEELKKKQEAMKKAQDDSEQATGSTGNDNTWLDNVIADVFGGNEGPQSASGSEADLAAQEAEKARRAQEEAIADAIPPTSDLSSLPQKVEGRASEKDPRIPASEIAESGPSAQAYAAVMDTGNSDQLQQQVVAVRSMILTAKESVSLQQQFSTSQLGILFNIR